ncbi:MAG: SpoIVB peptidase S55 domain-containing protein [Actinomycetota bacterium]
MSERPTRPIHEHRGPVAASALAITLVATLLAAGPAPAATPCSTVPQTFPTSDMTPGMTGVGYTVLQGDTIVPFDVQLLGVMPNAIFLGVDVVAAKITGPASFLNTTGGAVAGMSGSPVYVNGRLAGAVAWAIAEDRQIFGLTAAEDMVGMFTLPGAGEPRRMPARIPLTAQVRMAAAASGSALAPGTTMEALPVPLGVSGLNGMPLADIEASFADHGLRVQAFRAGTVAAPTAPTVDPTPFAPGDGMGAALSYGDVSFFGFGTTTAVCGDVAIGFGHPMFSGLGRVSLGMNEVDVIAIDNGTFWGTKIGILGAAHGEVTQDRFTGIAGVFGEMPDLRPIRSTVTSLDTELTRDGETLVAWDDPFFMADASFSHAWSNLTYVSQGDTPGTLRLAWVIRGTREDGSPFKIANRTMSYSSYSAASEAYRMAEDIYQLVNRGEDVSFTSVRMTGTITEENLTSRIEGLRVSSPLQRSLRPRDVVLAEPGDVVTVEITLDPVDGRRFTTTARIRVPRDASGLQRVDLSGGRERGPRGGDLDDVIDALNGATHANDVVVRGFGVRSIRGLDVIVRGNARFFIRVV